MKLHLAVYGSLCAARKFMINGINADTDDFGCGWDAAPTEECYICGNRVWRCYAPLPVGTLDKYGITADEAAEVCDELEEMLSFGRCGMCE